MKSKSIVRKAAFAITAWSCMACATFAADGKIKASDSVSTPSFTGRLALALGADMSAMAMKGRNLFMGIVCANTDREAAGLPSLWPRTTALEDMDKDDITGKAYSKSTDYFRDLFDMSDPGKEEKEPYVSCNMDVAGKDFDNWCVIANITDEMPDFLPVLISANFNPELLPSKWDGTSGSSKQLPIGPAHGAAKSLFDDKAIIVVMKDGSSKIIKGKNLTYETLYGGKSFDLTNAKPPVVYLTPKGIAKPTARR